MLLYFGFVMAYNQEMLAEAGIEVPTSWDEASLQMAGNLIRIVLVLLHGGYPMALLS